VLLSSHLLAEVEELCNRVAIVRSGRVVYQGSLAELRAQAGEDYVLRTTEDGIAQRVAEIQPGVSAVRPRPEGGLTFRADGEEAVSALSLALTESGALIRELSPRHASLEDLFFSLTEGDKGVETRREHDERGGAPAAPTRAEAA
jgi:ABC-2 type transport system ATP-binding protein